MYVRVVLRLQVGKSMVLSTEAFTWLYRDHVTHPVDRMLKHSAVALFHQDNFRIAETVEVAAEIFAKAVESDAKDLQLLKGRCALFRTYFGQAMPLDRGTEAVAEWIEASIYDSFNCDVVYSGLMGLKAMTSLDINEFVRSYDQLVKVIPREDTDG